MWLKGTGNSDSDSNLNDKYDALQKRFDELENQINELGKAKQLVNRN